MLEIIGTIVGIIYLWLEYKASIYLWIAGIIMPAIYIFVFFDAGLYADFAINIYYLLAAIYGWTMWKYEHRFGKNNNNNEADNETQITSTPHRLILPLAITFTLTFFLIATTLIHLTDSSVPWANAFTTALSVIGMWMLAKKYVEQWLVWIVVNTTCTALYLHMNLHFTAALYLLYAIIAIFGYRKWKTLMTK